MPATEVGSACPRRPEIEFKELGFWAYKLSSLNLVCKQRNRVRWTRFQGLQTESKELGLYAQKPSSLNSVSFSPPVTHQRTQKILNKNIEFQKYIVSTLIPSHSRSLSHSLTLLPVSVSLSLSLSCFVFVAVTVAITPSLPHLVFLPQQNFCPHC